MISIIVPVYKVEKYLKRCVNSLLSQTYADLEIILVDDGSPDTCPALCDEIAKGDKRIVVVHQKNMGLAGARNTGIEAAKGDFIGFVDSDDWIEKDTYQHCMELIESYKADVIQFQLGYAYNDSTRFTADPLKLDVYNDKEVLENYMYTTTTGKGGDYSVCVCLFRREVLDGVRFRVGKINEDIDFKYKALSRCHTMVNSNQKKYYYFQQEETLSTGGLRMKDFDLYEAADELIKLSEGEQYGTIRKLVEVKSARTPLSLLCKIAYSGIADSSIVKKDVVKRLTQELRNNLGILLLSPIPLSRKVLSILFAINYRMTELLVRTVK